MNYLVSFVLMLCLPIWDQDDLVDVVRALPRITLSFVSLASENVSTATSSSGNGEKLEVLMLLAACLSRDVGDAIDLTPSQRRKLGEIRTMIEVEEVELRSAERRTGNLDREPSNDYRQRIDDALSSQQRRRVYLLQLRGAIRRLGVERSLSEISRSLPAGGDRPSEIDVKSVFDETLLDAQSSFATIEAKYRERCRSCMNADMKQGMEALEATIDSSSFRDPGLQFIVMSHLMRLADETDDEAALPAILQIQGGSIDMLGRVSISSVSATPGFVDSLIAEGLQEELGITGNQVMEHRDRCDSDAFLSHGAEDELETIQTAFLRREIDVNEVRRRVQELGDRMAQLRWEAFLAILLPHQMELLEDALLGILVKRTGPIGWAGSPVVHRKFELGRADSEKIQGHVQDYLNELKDLSVRLERDAFTKLSRDDKAGIVLSRLLRELAAMEEAGVGLPLLIFGERQFPAY